MSTITVSSARPVGRNVGKRIAALRLERGLTLEVLAKGTGLTPSYLSRLERGLTSISVDNLRNVAHFLGVEMVHFFGSEESQKAIVTRKGKGTPLVIAGTDVYGESLVTTTRSVLQATLYRTPPGEGRLTGFSHAGQEFVFILRGRLRYSVGESKFELASGDSIWHPSTEPHAWSNIGKTPAISMHVNTPPVW